MPCPPLILPLIFFLVLTEQQRAASPYDSGFNWRLLYDTDSTLSKRYEETFGQQERSLRNKERNDEAVGPGGTDQPNQLVELLQIMHVVICVIGRSPILLVQLPIYLELEVGRAVWAIGQSHMHIVTGRKE
jgi:hypothetical protein